MYTTIILCTLIAPLALLADTNLLPDNGFEQAAAGSTMPEGWSGQASEGVATFEIVEDAFKSGHRSVHVRGGKKPGDAILYHSIKPELTEGETYTFSCWVRTKELKGRAYLALFQYPPPFDKKRDQRSSKRITGDNAWTKVALTFEARPGLTSLQLRFGVMWRGEDVGGDVWFDDAAIVPGNQMPAEAPKPAAKPKPVKIEPPRTVDPLDVDHSPVEGHVAVEPKLFRLDFPEADFKTAAPLMLTRPTPVGVGAWHFRTGVPLARGVLTDAANVSLSRDSKTIPIQTETLATWGPPGTRDAGSIRWLGIDFVDAIEADAYQAYTLHIGKPASVDRKVNVIESDDRITVNNGRLAMTFSKRGFNPFEAVKIDGRALPKSPGAYMTDSTGMRYLAANDREAKVEVEMEGPLAAVVRAEGWFVNPDGPDRRAEGEPLLRPKGGFCRFVTRVYIAADLPQVRVQHTFILTEDSNETRYGDIGMVVPAPGAKAVTFGGVDQSIEGSAYILQKRWDQFDVIDGAGKTIASGPKSDGSARAGTTGVVVREFWQNYPKEISFAPGTEALTVHFWPKHGIKRAETVEEFNYENGWRLPFVHSGKLLDFNIPKALYENEKEFPPKTLYYVPSSKRAHAMGVGKTHHLLINFAADDSFADRAAVYQARPHALPSPKYIEHTEAIDAIAAARPEKYPLAEHYMHNNFKWVLRIKEHYNAYGMWNWGDVNHYFRSPQRVKENYIYPRWRRLWAATHHGYVRLPWWMYLRNGDPDLLDHARAHTQHIADVDICHWTNKRWSEHSTGYDKEVGGLCDYKGIVHWHSGDRSHYNAMADHLLYDYYLTGNRRSWDIALEHGHYVTTSGQADKGREGAGQLDTYASMWEATWDDKFKTALETLAARYMRMSWDYHHAQFWSPWAYRYWRLTRDAKVKQWVLLWAAKEATHFRYGPIATAWYMTGSKRWARKAAVNVFLESAATTVRDDDLDGNIGGQWNTRWAFPVRDLMLSMKAASTIDLTLRDLSPEGYNREGYPNSIPYALRTRDTAAKWFKGKLPWPDIEDMRETIIFYHDGSNRTVRLGTRRQSATTTIRLLDPSGEKVVEHVREGRWGAGFRVRNGHPRQASFGVDNKAMKEAVYTGPEQLFDWASTPHRLGPGDAKGFYRVQYEGTDHWISAPLYKAARGRVWFPVGGDSVWMLAGHVFFYVPEDCKRFEMHFLPPYHPPSQGRNDLRMSSGVVLDPEMNMVGRIQCGLQTTPQVLAFEPTVGQRGKVWCVVGKDVTLAKMVGAPPFVSPTYEAFESEPRHPVGLRQDPSE